MAHSYSLDLRDRVTRIVVGGELPRGDSPLRGRGGNRGSVVDRPRETASAAAGRWAGASLMC